MNNMQGKNINGFILQRLLGTGGMAEVWYAENEIGMKAAVKIMSEKLSHDEQMQDRFLNEAKVMVKLDHPNIRKVYGYGSIDNRPAIIMEYLDGSDLKARMKRGQHFSQEELKRWWNQIVDALNFTHQKGIVHRDIKPGNIFVDTEGNIKLLDFGIAKVREIISSTQTGQKLGTLMYMSPEQVKDSKHIDYRTDVYSLAVTFVHLITRKKPYDSDTSSDFEISEQIVYKPLDLSGLPKKWQSFLAPYLDKAPEQRPDLRFFEDQASKEESVVPDKDEDTEVGDVKHPNPQPVVKPSPKPQSVDDKAKAPEPSEKPKNRKGLWIGLGVVAVSLVALLLFMLKPKVETIQTDPDTETYQACQSVSDYRTYLATYGHNAIHYTEAKRFVDSCVADSTAQEEKALAEAQAKEQAEKEEAERAEAEKKEEAAYKKCTSIEGCDAYLDNYPEGKFVAKVKKKKKELEQEEEFSVFDKCVTIAECNNYLEKYPDGKYLDWVKGRKWGLEKENRNGYENGVYVYFYHNKYEIPRVELSKIRIIADYAIENDYFLVLESAAYMIDENSSLEIEQILAENWCNAVKGQLVKFHVPENKIIMRPVKAGVVRYEMGRCVQIQLNEEP